MSHEDPRPDRDDEGPGRYSEPGDAGSPLSEDEGNEGTSEGVHQTTEQPDADPNPVPRREQGGL
jgi:hypothetical protein